MKKIHVLCISSLIFLSWIPLQAHAKSFVDEEVSRYIHSVGGQVSIHYEDLQTHDVYTYQTDTTYYAASTVKLPLMLFIMELAEQGKLDLQKKLTYESHHYVGGSGELQYAPVGTRYSIEQLIEQAIEKSDNVAFAILKEYIGEPAFAAYMKRLGATNHTTEAYSMVSTHDLNIYAKRLFELQRVSKYGKQLNDYMTHTIFNDALPKHLNELSVAHKVGMMPRDLVSHDYGIVYDHDEHPYVLSIMTFGYSYEKSNEVIAKIAAILHQKHRQDHFQVEALLHTPHISYF